MRERNEDEGMLRGCGKLEEKTWTRLLACKAALREGGKNSPPPTGRRANLAAWALGSVRLQASTRERTNERATMYGVTYCVLSRVVAVQDSREAASSS
jgi:hypothetical protein